MRKMFLIAVLSAVCYAAGWSQTPSIDLSAQYKFTDKQGLSLSQSGTSGVVSTPDRTNKNQLWTFVASPDAGYYHLKNVGTGDYIFASTGGDFWNVTFAASVPSDIGKSEFAIEDLGDGYIGLLKKESHDGPNEYLGTTDTRDGSPIYGTCKSATDNIFWTMTVITNDMSALNDLIAQVQAYENSDLSTHLGLAGEMEDFILAYSTPANTDSATIKTCMDSITAEWDRIKQGLSDANMLTQLIQQSGRLLNTTNFAGHADFQTAYDAANKVSQDAENSKTTDYATALANLTAAQKAYYATQTASIDAPADYTFMVKHPWFCKEAYNPASNSLDDIAAANLSGSIIDGDGWVNGSFISQGWSDMGNTYAQNRTCYSTWAQNFGYVDIHQDVTGLPNGLYSISCDALTQSGCANDQHAYATSAVQTVISPFMTVEGWSDGAATDARWETLNTADNGKVYVSDGKLTIGCTGSRDVNKANTCNGWFCVTNFQLKYYGPADVATLQALLSTKTAAYQAQCDTMLFKGDKAAYQSAIDLGKSATDVDAMSAALVAMNNAQKAAVVSISAQDKVVGSAYTAIKDSIAAGVYTDATLLDVMQTAVNNATAFVNAENQTYVCSDSVINSMNAYLNSYATEYNKAQQALATYIQQGSKDVVNATIKGQLAQLKSGMLPDSVVVELAAQIERALKDAAANEILAGGGSDYTGIIINPTCDSNNHASVTGWTVKHNQGSNACNWGQQYDGQSGQYLDSYSQGAGTLLYNAHQTLTNIPNGTYNFKAMCRTSGEPGKEGTYLYAIADKDSVNGVKLALVKRELTNVTKATLGQFVASDGTDSIAYERPDTYGSIWEAAAVATDYGTEGSVEDMNIYATRSYFGPGLGWRYVDLTIEVKNHVLTIGYTNDSTFTGGRVDIEGNACMPFTGEWISADNFTLTLKSAGNNTDWSPITGIASVIAGDGLSVTAKNGRILTNMPCRIYNLNGQQVSGSRTLPNGVYIVKSGRESRKVIVD